MKKQTTDKRTKREIKDEEEGLTYPPFEDIYNRANEIEDLDPDDLRHRKAPNEKPGAKNEKDFEEARSGSDLDITGAKTDEQNIPNVDDEENDYYSLGADKDD